MNKSDILQILNDEKTWLADQPGMQPWDEGCGRVLALLATSLDEYSKLVRAPNTAKRDTEQEDEDCPNQPVRAPNTAAPDPDVDIYLARLARCLVHHWHDATKAADDGLADAGRVAERIAAGQGYRRGGRLGGDPLRDVVLAVAMVRKDDRATRVFQKDYLPFARALASKIDGRLGADPWPWWSGLLDQLAGYTRPKAKLDRFYGRCGLRNWLGRVFWRFLVRWPLDVGDGPELDEPLAKPAPDNESLKRFGQVVRPAVGCLSADDRLVLAFFHVPPWPNDKPLTNKQAAAILGVSEGTATRRHQKALERLQERIQEVAKSELSNDAWESVLDDLEKSPLMFALVLGRALDQNASDQAS